MWHGKGLFDSEDRLVRLRFGPANDDRVNVAEALVIRELYVTARTGVSGRLIRSLPLSRYEAAVNTPGARALLDPVLKLAGLTISPWPDQRRLWESDDRDWWMVPPRYRKRRDAEPPDLRIEVPKRLWMPRLVLRGGGRALRLLDDCQHPAGQRVASRGDEVPVTTVHGWVKEARKRGLLKGRQPRGRDSVKGSTMKRCSCPAEYDSRGRRKACSKKHGSWATSSTSAGTQHRAGARAAKSGFRTQAEAAAAMAEVLGEVDQGRYRHDAGQTSPEYLDTWLDQQGPSTGHDPSNAPRWLAPCARTSGTSGCATSRPATCRRCIARSPRPTPLAASGPRPRAGSTAPLSSALSDARREGLHPAQPGR